jgi:hypothetical protein
MDVRRSPVAAAGMPAFRRDSVLERPGDETAGPHTVSPGLHRIDGAGPDQQFEVVWWDPAALRLDVEPPFGLRREELIARDVAPDVVAEGERRFITWRNRRAAAVESGRTPSVVVRTVTEYASDVRPLEGGAVADVEVIVLDAEAGRPTGARYGTLVHAVLATVPLDADRATLDAIVRTQARIVGATGDETASALRVVAQVLAHPLFHAAREADAAGRCLREMPVTATADGSLIEGVVDFAFETDAGYCVIDFKTDRAVGDLLDRYRRQVQFYAGAIARATGRPARAVLLKV